MKITAKFLKSKQACISQLRNFTRLFPDGVEPTEELCLTHASEFDWDWAAENLLDAAAYAEYERICDVAYAEYEGIRNTAYAEYRRIWEVAHAKYVSIRAGTRLEYVSVRAPALAEYVSIRAGTRLEYERVCAAAFGKLYTQAIASAIKEIQP